MQDSQLVKGVTYNQLKRPLFYRLCRWVDDTKQLYENVSHDDVARKASELLKTPITKHNIESARAALGISLSRGRKAGSRGGQDRLRIVVGAVLMIMKELDIEPPEDLVRLWRKQ
jgi:hypothetical protein